MKGVNYPVISPFFLTHPWKEFLYITLTSSTEKFQMFLRVDSEVATTASTRFPLQHLLSPQSPHESEGWSRAGGMATRASAHTLWCPHGTLQGQLDTPPHPQSSIQVPAPLLTNAISWDPYNFSALEIASVQVRTLQLALLNYKLYRIPF